MTEKRNKPKNTKRKKPVPEEFRSPTQLESERIEAASRFAAAQQAAFEADRRSPGRPVGRYVRNADWLNYDQWLPTGKVLADIMEWNVTVQTTSDVADGRGALCPPKVGTVASVDHFVRESGQESNDVPFLVGEQNVLMILALPMVRRIALVVADWTAIGQAETDRWM
jgi:hypothetical protein